MEFKEIIEDFNVRAKKYNEIINEVIPYYGYMLNTIVDFMPFDKNDKINVLDLGCGIGNTTAKILEKFPNAKIVAVDLAPNAVEIAQKRFYGKNVSILNKDIRDLELYKYKKYDCVVSNLAIHHIKDDDEKFRLYENIYKAIVNGGSVIIGENVHGSSDFLTKKYEEIWIKYMEKLGLSEKKINQYYNEYIEKDHPTSMIKQINVLNELGFKNVDCMWKYSFFAVFGGNK